MNKKELLVISITIFLTIVAWLIADIVHVSAEEKIKSGLNIPPTRIYHIDKEVFNILESKKE